MSTIREELAGFTSLADKLRTLGIDPDLPAEWATEGRCLTWLREQGCKGMIGFDESGGYIVWSSIGRFVALTLHAALIAACRAVQEEA